MHRLQSASIRPRLEVTGGNLAQWSGSRKRAPRHPAGLVIGLLWAWLCLPALGAETSVDAAANQVAGLNYAGSWELDAGMSENLADKARMLYAARVSEARRQAARGEGSIALSSGEMLAGDVDAILGLGRLAELITQATVLRIHQSGEQIVVERNEDFALVCEFDNPRVTGSSLGVQQCGWRDGQLAFELLLPQGLHVSHLLTLSPARDRLNIATTVRAARSRQTFTLNRVYMPFEDLPEEYDCRTTLSRQKTCTLGKQ